MWSIINNGNLWQYQLKINQHQHPSWIVSCFMSFLKYPWEPNAMPCLHSHWYFLLVMLLTSSHCGPCFFLFEDEAKLFLGGSFNGYCWLGLFVVGLRCLLCLVYLFIVGGMDYSTGNRLASCNQGKERKWPISCLHVIHKSNQKHNWHGNYI